MKFSEQAVQNQSRTVNFKESELSDIRIALQDRIAVIDTKRYAHIDRTGKEDEAAFIERNRLATLLARVQGR